MHKLETTIQTYKAKENKYFYTLERGDTYYSSNLKKEFYDTHNEAVDAAFDKDRELKSK